MLAMNNEGFPLFKRTCKICLLPRPWPKCQARTMLSVDQKLALRRTDSPREKALFLYAEMTANLPHTRKLLHSPRHPLLAYSEMACQGCWQGLLVWALKRCLLNGYLVVYTFFLPYYRSTFIDLLSQSPPYSRPFRVLPRTAWCW